MSEAASRLRERELPPWRPLPDEPGGDGWKQAPLPDRAYFICTVQRSGSTRLCEALRDTGRLGWPAEYFVRWEGPADYRASFPGNDAEFLQWVAWQGSTRNGVLGLKVMANQLAPVTEALRRVLGMDGAPPRALFQAWLPGSRFVRLHRADRVRQAISLYRQRVTGVSHLARDAEAPPAPRFDYRAIANALQYIKRCERSWDAFFGEVPPDLSLESAELLEASEAAVQGVASLLGEPAPKALPPSRRRKLSDDLTERWVREFRRQERIFRKLGGSA